MFNCLLVAGMAELVVRHTLNTIVNKFETAGPRHNAVIMHSYGHLLIF
jgi:hypothetical protein